MLPNHFPKVLDVIRLVAQEPEDDPVEVEVQVVGRRIYADGSATLHLSDGNMLGFEEDSWKLSDPLMTGDEDGFVPVVSMTVVFSAPR